VDYGGFLGDPGEALSFVEQIVVEVEC